jgi:uncharacterized ferritin-like protein (DUF455 family)
MSVDDLVHRYLGQFDVALGTGRTLAGFSPLIPEIDDKATLVDCTAALIDLAGLVRNRLWELRIPHDHTVGRQPRVLPELRAAAMESDWRAAIQIGQSLCARLADDLAGSAAGPQGLAVSADVRIVAAAADPLRRAAGKAPPLTADLSPSTGGANETVPVPPCPERAYPAGVTLVDTPVAVNKRPTTASELGGFLHDSLQIEFVALDVPMRNLADFGDLPFEFYAHMSRHAHDEMRHIRMLLAEMSNIGVGIGEHPFEVPDRYAVLATEDLPFRLIILSRTGEAEAMEACAILIPMLRANGWPDVARMYEHVQCDETRHTWYANHWLRYLVGDDDDKVADATAVAIERYNELLPTAGLRSKPRPPDYLRAYSPLGLDEAGRLHAGFTQSEVALMREARQPTERLPVD